jgi:amino acid transporter
VRDSGLAWTIPTYTFVVSLTLMLVIGVWKAIQTGGHPVPVQAPPALAAAAAPVTLWLIFRAFASGCTAMTGVEAVSNAVPMFAEPRIRNAGRTLLLICTILGVFLGGIGYLAHAYGIGARVQTQPGYESVVSQLVSAVVGRGALYYITLGSLLAVLTLSANTSFAGFPRICRILAEDWYLPSACATLGRRLVYTLGIIILTVCSATLLIVFEGITDHLIPLFAFGAFTCGEIQGRRLDHGARHSGVHHAFPRSPPPLRAAETGDPAAHCSANVEDPAAQGHHPDRRLDPRLRACTAHCHARLKRYHRGACNRGGNK